MVTKRFWTLAALATCAVWSVSTAVAAPIYFDFGDSSQTTPGNYNNITLNTNVPPVLSIANAIDSTGAPTGISLNVSGFFPGSNLNGTTTPSGAAAIFDPQATRDNAFTHVGAFGGQTTNPTGVLEFAGLDPSMTYNVVFFASRTGVTDNREAKYTLNGGNSLITYLDAANNTSNVAQVSGILATGAGTLTVLVEKGPNNTNGTGFAYLGALCIECIVPEPTSGLLMLFGGCSLGAFRSSRQRS